MLKKVIANGQLSTNIGASDLANCKDNRTLPSMTSGIAKVQNIYKK